MPDRSADSSPARSGRSSDTLDPGEGSLASTSWLGLVVLLNYVAAGATFAAAGGYLILKAQNEQQSALMQLVEEIPRRLYSLGLHEMPGMPTDYVGLRNFADPTFADAYLIGMATAHLLAAGGFLALAVALAGFRPWARRVQLVLAMLALLMTGGYALVYARSAALSRLPFAAMAVAAVVTSAVIAILLAPGVSRRFHEGLAAVSDCPISGFTKPPGSGTRPPSPSAQAD